MVRLEVTEPIFQRIQGWAVPLVDSTDSTLTKILDAADYQRGLPPTPTQVGPRSGPSGSTLVSRSSKRARTSHVLLRGGVLQSGTRLRFVWSQMRARPDYEPSDPRFEARVGAQPGARANIIWNFDGRAYSLSALTEKLRDDEGIDIARGALNGYDFWALEANPMTSLWTIAEELGRS